MIYTAFVPIKIDIPDADGGWVYGNTIEFFVHPLIQVRVIKTGEVEIEVVEEPTPC